MRREDKGKSTVDIRTSINIRPMSPYQWLIIAVITYLNALDGYDLVATAFAAPHLAEEFAIGSSLLGWVLSATLLGVGVGAAIFGPAGDRWGRRNVILVALLIDTVGLLLSGFAGSTAAFIVWRFVTGVGVGGVLACVTGMYTVTPASYPTHLRATGVGVALAVGRVGAVCGPLLIGYLAEAGLGPRGLYVGAASVFVLSAVALVGLRAPAAKPVVVKEPVEVLSA